MKEQKNQPKNQKPNQEKPLQPSKKVETVEVDASGKVLGRLATEIANILRGKNKPGFRPNLVCGDKVKVVNAAKLVVTGQKMDQKIYYHHTGYLGHLKEEQLKDVFAKNPSVVLERAVYGMLPTNKLRKFWMKNLEISN